ncbi:MULTISPECIES: malic enzyme-like NAD(P)-binding protein [unclassified Halomonas]|uniref:malic enzyme-like NAD(P)-binding protein n=1 Tax=unclassified Halomonas TaxID=2609666 RepID=UPI0021E4DE2A|nr:MULTISPECIES: malic enzyme-like NAD(P)-binding protein [unclassified Halomonas]UYG00504.1 malate dehydrogenase [Halomonas sp. GD1P12]WNL38421.1 malic enzyme-like NAD(P)-binding protein [Halomonas sp. PAMB 3232]WNL41721.1 malic enzyme-like NAD(P)-binding protein [Halomonas sp. PAMB 3264]
MTDANRQAALDYHANPIPGKLSVELTKSTATARDLSLAYSPGVAEPVREIAADAENAYRYTGKGNLVAVISDGSAILGLGNLGPLASKPVMEGKGVLFKCFAGINSVDIEVDAENPQAFIDTVARIADTWGGINLEDIKAPECFEIEKALIERCSIPVFHDDQHGTAIVTAAGMLNALEIAGKRIEDVNIVCMGAGAAAIACMRLLISCGASAENLVMLDRRGVIHSGRENINEYKAEFARDTEMRTLDDAIDGADVFIGLSGPGLLSAEQVKKMAADPVIFACTNPDPEIHPDVAREARPDVIMATGRSDFPNQVNNVLGFPFIFRGALDVRATRINEAMKLAAVHALKDLAREPVPEEVLNAYERTEMSFGREYIIPTPVDVRLLERVSAAVARAAVDSGVARKPYPAHYPLKTINNVYGG